MQILAWILLLALLASYFGDLLERQRNPNQDVRSMVTTGGCARSR